MTEHWEKGNQFFDQRNVTVFDMSSTNETISMGHVKFV